MKQVIKKVNIHMVPCEGIQEKINQCYIDIINNTLDIYNLSNEEKLYIYNKLIQTTSE